MRAKSRRRARHARPFAIEGKRHGNQRKILIRYGLHHAKRLGLWFRQHFRNAIHRRARHTNARQPFQPFGARRDAHQCGDHRQQQRLMFQPGAIGRKPFITRPFRMAQFSGEFRKQPVIATTNQHWPVRRIKRLIGCQVRMAGGMAFRQLAHIHIGADLLPRP